TRQLVMIQRLYNYFFFSSRRRHTRFSRDWSSDVCSSDLYREKTQQINRLLAERYKDHPALIMWHVSNEYGGECHCDLCQEAFREIGRASCRERVGMWGVAASLRRELTEGVWHVRMAMKVR